MYVRSKIVGLEMRPKSRRKIMRLVPSLSNTEGRRAAIRNASVCCLCVCRHPSFLTRTPLDKSSEIL